MTKLRHTPERVRNPTSLLTVVLVLAGMLNGCAPVRRRAALGIGCVPRPTAATHRPLGPSGRISEPAITCEGLPDIWLPSPISDHPVGSGTLYAGFAEVDITPPPGLGLFGWATEALIATGHQNRLKARVFVVENGPAPPPPLGSRTIGEVIAFVVADLGAISTILHRLTAAEIHRRTNGSIGADRLMISATHTHSGPGQYLTAWPHNVIGSPRPGYDPNLADSPAARIAGAVEQAFVNRREAQIGWGVSHVWGRTRNRAYDAFLLNTTKPAASIPPPPLTVPLDHLRMAVNPTWTMLRVKIKDDGGTFRDAGSFSMFAIHGTAIPGGNDLYDADILGMVSRKLAAKTEGGIHVIANGTEGDVSPDWPPISRCPPPLINIINRPGGPRNPMAFDKYRRFPEVQERCLGAAKEYLTDVTDTLASAGHKLWGSITTFHTVAPVRRAFQTVFLRDSVDLGRQILAPPELCDPPQVGNAATAGAPDGRTRLLGWRIFGIIPIGTEPGGHGIDDRQGGCQRPKRIALPILQRGVLSQQQWPEATQIAAVRIGDVIIGTVPGEATTVAGLRMMEAMKVGTRQADKEDDGHRIAIMGIANGHLGYITTPEEYTAQFYEGGSNIYGPRTADVVADSLRALTAELWKPSPTANVVGINVRPGPVRYVLPLAHGHTKSALNPSPLGRCLGDTVVVRWTDALPGDTRPWTANMVRFYRTTGSALRVEDDETQVEVRVLKIHRRLVVGKPKSATMEARWTPPGGTSNSSGRPHTFTFSLLRWTPGPSVRIATTIAC